MSDGPHRCLSLRKPWKDAAKAAASDAFSDEEVEQRVLRAVRNDWIKEVPEAFMIQLRRVFGAEEQGSLLPPTIGTAIELAGLVPGSAFVSALAECAEDAAARGVAGAAAIADITSAALEDRAERSLRHIQEIYQRESSLEHAKHVMGRVSESLNRAVAQLASELGEHGRSARVAPIVRATGIEEGPRL
jgi:hypothetical protein